jgi:hypothetical protein
VKGEETKRVEEEEQGEEVRRSFDLQSDSKKDSDKIFVPNNGQGDNYNPSEGSEERGDSEREYWSR